MSRLGMMLSAGMMGFGFGMHPMDRVGRPTTALHRRPPAKTHGGRPRVRAANGGQGGKKGQRRG